MKFSLTWENIYSIFIKEIKETLRDHRTLFVMTLLPILLYPILMLGMTQLILYKIGEIEHEDTPVAVEGHSEKILNLLEKENFRLISTVDARREVTQEKAVLGLQIPPEFDSKIETLEETPRIQIYYSGANDQAKIVSNKLEKILCGLLYNVKKKALHDTPGYFNPFRIVLKNIAGANKQGAFEFGRLLAILVVLMAITFPLYPAIDMGAGEKERGTMETLLVSPATRFQIVIGKYLAIFAIALIGSLLNLGSMGLTFGYFAQQSGSWFPAHRSISKYRDQQIRNLYPVIFEKEPTLYSDTTKISNIYFLTPDQAIVFNHKAVTIWNVDMESQIGLMKWPLKFKKLTAVTRKGKHSWLAGNEKGELIEFFPRKHQVHKRFLFPACIQKIVVSPDHKRIAVLSGQIYILNAQWREEKVLPVAGIPLAISPDSRKILVREGQQIKLIHLDSGSVEQTFPGDLAIWMAQGQYIINTNGNLLEIRDLHQGQILTSSHTADNNGLQEEPDPITALKLEQKEEKLFIGRQSGIVELWQVKSKAKVELQYRRFLGGHDHAIISLEIDNNGYQCLSLDDQGIAKKWSLAPPLKFSISLLTIVKMFTLLIPLIGLFSALCLGISIFARSYKEGQHYLTPLIIVIMPLVMVALLPNMVLTLRFCLVPVANVVLLYKEILLGNAGWQQFFLVFGSTFIYAALALHWTVNLFQKEEVLFREARTVRWAFWRKGLHDSETFTYRQAVILFLFITVGFHFGGPYIVRYNFLWGQVAAMFLFLVAIPLGITLICKHSVRRIYALRRPYSYQQFIAAVLMTIAVLIIGAGLHALQQKLFPVDKSFLEKMYRPFFESLQKESLWALLACISITPGICEEFFFRGLILSSLLCYMRSRKAIIMTAFFFAMMHVDFTRFSFTLVMGIWLGILLVRTGSIFPPMLAHALSNGIVIFLGYSAEVYPVVGHLLETGQLMLVYHPLRAVTSGALLAILLLIVGNHFLKAGRQK